MLKKRVIPVLLLKDGRMVKGRQFKDFRDTGDPQAAVRIYSAQDADELVFLDTQASLQSRGALLGIVRLAASECFMPLAVGGGIKTVDDVRELVRAGADKVVITTAAFLTPDLIRETSESFGKQCVIAGIDYRGSGSGARAWIQSGTRPTDRHPLELAKTYADAGAGEILLNSIDRDGCMEGYDLEMGSQIAEAVRVPVILCGGAGNFMHLADALQKTSVSAAACASLFHFGDNNPIRARSYLKNLNIPLRMLR